MRSTMIIGNWKMNKSPIEARAYLQKLLPLIGDASSSICLSVPFIDIEACSKVARSSPINIGAQNVCEFENGPFTGEVSAQMVKSLGATFSLIGHSERRTYFNENSEILFKKVRLCLKHGLTVVFCFGETLKERQEGRALAVVTDQIKEVLSGLSAQEMEHIVLAYEPVWAIGTGQTASSEEAQKMHSACRSLLKDMWTEALAEKTLILYGGSVTDRNIENLLSQSDIDGALIGGASLDPDVFAKLCSIGMNR
jgi:triosephosphate isomerase